jgi:hypothetical protein
MSYNLSIDFTATTLFFFSSFLRIQQHVSDNSSSPQTSTPPSQPATQGHGLSLAEWELAGQSIAQNYEREEEEGACRSGARAWERLTGYTTKSRRAA